MSANSSNFIMLKKHILLFIFMLSQVNSEQGDHIHTTMQYTKDNFSTEIQKKNHFIMFYAPWYASYFLLYFLNKKRSFSIYL